MLKFELETMDGVDEAVQQMYEEKDGKYFLKVDGLPGGDSGEVEKLRKEVEATNKKNRELLKSQADAKKAAEAAALETAKKSGDIESIEKSLHEKYSSTLAEKDQSLSDYQRLVYDLTVRAESSRMAAEIAVEGASSVLEPHIEKRLRADIQDGKSKITILDKSGNPTAYDLNDLKKEFTADPAFARIVVGSRATGTGQKGQGSGGRVNLKRSEMTVEQRKKYIIDHGGGEEGIKAFLNLEK